MLKVPFTEVAITRRVYRSGESEYSINRNACRLRDIQDLFCDTGIGKDGYSIISQGKVEEILSNKSGDRRAAFEEAAGVMRYRVRKEEAERNSTIPKRTLNESRISSKSSATVLAAGGAERVRKGLLTPARRTARS
jgi:chromosome segregation protein